MKVPLPSAASLKQFLQVVCGGEYRLICHSSKTSFGTFELDMVDIVFVLPDLTKTSNLATFLSHYEIDLLKYKHKLRHINWNYLFCIKPIFKAIRNLFKDSDSWNQFLFWLALEGNYFVNGFSSLLQEGDIEEQTAFDCFLLAIKNKKVATESLTSQLAVVTILTGDSSRIERSLIDLAEVRGIFAVASYIEWVLTLLESPDHQKKFLTLAISVLSGVTPKKDPLKFNLYILLYDLYEELLKIG